MILSEPVWTGFSTVLSLVWSLSLVVLLCSQEVPVFHLFLCFVETLPEEKISLMVSLMGPQCEKRKENVTRLQIAKESFSLIEIVFRNLPHTLFSLSI